MGSQPPKGSKRNPLTADDMPYLVRRDANYWFEVEGRLVEVLTLERNPAPGQRVLVDKVSPILSQ